MSDAIRQSLSIKKAQALHLEERLGLTHSVRNCVILNDSEESQTLAVALRCVSLKVITSTQINLSTNRVFQ